MTAADDPTLPHDSVDGIIAAYLEAIDAGQNLDRQALFARYPQHGERLRLFFRDHDLMDRAAAPLRLADALESPSDTPNTTSNGGAGSSRRIRYFGDYELFSEIARGGMGIVYKARQVSLNRIVALKMILAGQFASETEVQQFYSEARAAANLQHPNIVAIHEVGQHENQHYFSMDYIEGNSLAQIVRESPLSAAKAAGYAKVIAEAIEFAHRRGTLHRDLKPSNVLIDRFDRPQITDFGLAKRIEGTAQMTASGSLAGTPSYMPPEQAGAHEGKVGPPSDVYSLGALLYELVTGRPPFLAETLIATLNQVLNSDPVSPRLLNPKVPPDLETICLKCLEKDPNRRYPTAEALAADLGRFLRHEPITARPVSRWERAWRWCKRNPATSSLSAVIVLILLFAAIGGSALAISERDARRAADINAQRATDESARADSARLEADRRRIEAQAQRERAEAALKESEVRLYASQIAAAQAEWNARSPLAAWNSLDACRWEERGWEHRYISTLFHKNQITFRGHKGPVSCASFSPDGKRIVSGGDDETVNVWEAATGRKLLTLKGHAAHLRSVAFSPDGRRIVSGCFAGVVEEWDASTGRCLLTLQGNASQVTKVSFDSDGKSIRCIFQNDTIKIWEASSGRETLSVVSHRIPENEFAYVHDCSFNPDGKRVVVARSDDVELRETATGKTIKVLDATSIGACVAFSPDGKRILSGDALGGELIISDGLTGQRIRKLSEQPGDVKSVAFSADSTKVVSDGTDASVRVWDAQTGKELAALYGHKAAVNRAEFSLDGRQVVSASEDRSVKVWNLDSAPTGPMWRAKPYTSSRERWQQNGGFTIVSPDGSRFACLKRDDIFEIASTTDHSVSDLAYGPSAANSIVFQSVAFNSNGTLLACVDGNGREEAGEDLWDGTIKVFDVSSGKRVFEQPLKQSIGPPAFSPDGSLLAWTSQGEIIVCQLATGKRIGRHELAGSITTRPQFSPDGKRIACGSRRNVDDKRNGSSTQVCELYLWELNSDRLAVVPHPAGGTIRSIAFQRDGRLIALGSVNGDISLVDVSTAKKVRAFPAQVGSVRSLDFSPDGSRLASGGGDKTIRLWSVPGGQELLVLRGHTGPVMGLSFSSDGKRLVSVCAADGSAPSEVRVWDASKPGEDYYDSLLDPFFERFVLKADVIDALRKDKTLSDELRATAIEEATGREDDVDHLNDAAWDLVVKPNQKPEDYHRALRWAEAACRIEPKEMAYVNTLGVAQFRAGQFAHAIASLSQCHEENSKSQYGAEPADVAFLAMAHHALGHTREAEQFVRQLAELLKKEQWKDDEDAAAFFHEVQQRLAKNHERMRPPY